MKKEKEKKKRFCQIAIDKDFNLRIKHNAADLNASHFIAAFLRAGSLFLKNPNEDVHGFESECIISDYERGYSTQPKLSRQRYINQPTMNTLMRDIRRPAARDDATRALLEIIDDDELRGWALEQIREGRVNRLSVHVRPNLQNADILQAWRKELAEENAALDEAESEAAAQSELMHKLADIIRDNKSVHTVNPKVSSN